MLLWVFNYLVEWIIIVWFRVILNRTFFLLLGTNPKNVTINDLAIPDTMCSRTGDGGYNCPGNMECMKLDLSAKSEGFYGMFDHFGKNFI